MQLLLFEGMNVESRGDVLTNEARIKERRREGEKTTTKCNERKKKGNPRLLEHQFAVENL